MTVLPDMLAHRDALQAATLRGMGLKTRTIDGEPYVALTRGLSSDIVNEEMPLASHADNRHTGFGSHMHHTWVPLKDLWFSFEHGPKFSSGEMGPENEYLVSNKHPRYEATADDVAPARIRLETDPDDAELLYDDVKDEALAAALKQIPLKQLGDAYAHSAKLRPRALAIATHKNAGPLTHAALDEAQQRWAKDFAFAPSSDALVNSVIQTPMVPREKAWAILNSPTHDTHLRAAALRNPNLTEADLSNFATNGDLGSTGGKMNDRPDQFVSSILNNPNATSRNVEAVWNRIKGLDEDTRRPSYNGDWFAATRSESGCGCSVGGFLPSTTL